MYHVYQKLIFTAVPENNLDLPPPSAEIFPERVKNYPVMWTVSGGGTPVKFADCADFILEHPLVTKLLEMFSNILAQYCFFVDKN